MPEVMRLVVAAWENAVEYERMGGKKAVLRIEYNIHTLPNY